MKAKPTQILQGELMPKRLPDAPASVKVHRDALLEVVDPDKYSPYEFFCESCRRGESEKINLTVPKGFIQMLEHIKAWHPFYDSIQAICRDAVVHRVNFLRHAYDMPQEIRDLADALAIEMAVDTITSTIDRYRSSIENIRSGLEGAARDRDWFHFTEYLNRGHQMAEKMSNPYRDQLGAVLKGFRERHKEDVKQWRETRGDWLA